MATDATPATSESTENGFSWSARKLQPVILLYVATVFIAMMLISYFLFHSTTAVKALAIAAIGFLGPLLPGVLSRVEYRLTENRLESRPVNQQHERPLTTLFEFDQLSHVVQTGHGFKYYKQLHESSGFRHFWKIHISDAFSGEVHVEKSDQQRVFNMLARCGVSLKK